MDSPEVWSSPCFDDCLNLTATFRATTGLLGDPVATSNTTPVKIGKAHDRSKENQQSTNDYKGDRDEPEQPPDMNVIRPRIGNGL